jgi:signal transduction histidine kinase
MKRSTAWSYEWFYSLTVILLFASVVLRTLLIYTDRLEALYTALGLLAVCAIFFVSEPFLTIRWKAYFPIYLGLQSALIGILLFVSPDPPDYFAILLAVLSMQAGHHFQPRTGTIWIAAFFPLITLTLIHTTGLANALAFGLTYSAANALFGSFSLAARRGSEVHSRNQAMLLELQEANRQLEIYAQQMEQLASARERNRLARDLHDSVTQTVFSMTLATQSALLLLDRDFTQVKSQLGRLESLAKSAMAEMQTLIAELRPEKVTPGGLPASLRRLLDQRQMPENLTVSLEVEGDGQLPLAEEQGLYRIIQEALNNVVKHSRATRATIRLHQNEPQWLEIEDNGQGFDLSPDNHHHGVGLSSMPERATEIGWNWQIFSAPGSGTRIRVEKGVQQRRD